MTEADTEPSRVQQKKRTRVDQEMPSRTEIWLGKFQKPPILSKYTVMGLCYSAGNGNAIDNPCVILGFTIPVKILTVPHSAKMSLEDHKRQCCAIARGLGVAVPTSVLCTRIGVLAWQQFSFRRICGVSAPVQHSKYASTKPHNRLYRCNASRKTTRGLIAAVCGELVPASVTFYCTMPICMQTYPRGQSCDADSLNDAVRGCCVQHRFATDAWAVPRQQRKQTKRCLELTEIP